MKNATQVRELLDVIEVQRIIVMDLEQRYGKSDYEEELYELLGMYDELAGLCEEDLKS